MSHIFVIPHGTEELTRDTVCAKCKHPYVEHYEAVINMQADGALDGPGCHSCDFDELM